MRDLNLFLNEYFDLINRVNKFHYDFLIENGFLFPDNDNYIKLKRFIDTAANFLKDIDDKILHGLSGKLYKDVDDLYKFYRQFIKKTEYIETIFYNEYLNSLDDYSKIKSKVINLKEKIEEYNATIKRSEENLKKLPEKDENYKKIKRIYVDAIYELSKCKEDFFKNKKLLEEIEKKEEKRFFLEFKKRRELHLKKLESIINAKLFYFEKLLWFNAQKSEAVVKFFQKSNIQGSFSTKTFIEYFLKHIDEAKSNNSSWIAYLKDILKVIE